MSGITLIQGTRSELYVTVVPASDSVGYKITASANATEFTNETHCSIGILSLAAGTERTFVVSGLEADTGYYVKMELYLNEDGSETEVHRAFGVTSGDELSEIKEGATLTVDPGEVSCVGAFDYSKIVPSGSTTLLYISSQLTPTPFEAPFSNIEELSKRTDSVSRSSKLSKKYYYQSKNVAMTSSTVYTLVMNMYSSGLGVSSRTLSVTFTTLDTTKIAYNQSGTIETLEACFNMGLDGVTAIPQNSIRAAYEIYYNDNGTIKQVV